MMRICPHGENPDHCSYSSGTATATVPIGDPITEEQLRILRSLCADLRISDREFVEETRRFYHCEPEQLSKMRACMLIACYAARKRGQRAS
jgi:hypothetical protein